jgi:outer membrane protein assembly factor BamB
MSVIRKLVFLAALAFAAATWHLPGETAELWARHLGSSFDSCPAIAPDGTIYVTGSGFVNFKDFSGGKLAAITPAGAQKWVFKTVSDIKSSPAIGPDGTIYFGGRDRKLHAINPDGKERWFFAVKGWIDSSPAIGVGGTIYFGGWNGNFYALNPDGTKKWEFATEGVVDSSPAVGTDGTIYFGSHDKKFYAMNPDGTVKWKLETGGAICSSPALGYDGAVFITSADGNLYALNADGSEKWRLWTGGVNGSSPVIDMQGNIYVGVNDTFWAITPGGVKKWFFGYPVIAGSGAVAAEGTIYFAGSDNFGVGHLYASNPAGPDAGFVNTPLGGSVKCSPALGPDGTVYLGASEGRFRAMKGTGGPAASCWPSFRGNPMGTGRAGNGKER